MIIKNHSFYIAFILKINPLLKSIITPFPLFIFTIYVDNNQQYDDDNSKIPVIKTPAKGFKNPIGNDNPPKKLNSAAIESN